MISNIDQLKSFILWCKEQKIKSMDLGTVKFEISELDFVQDISQPVTDLSSNLSKYNNETLADTLEEPEDWRNDPDLFHSSNT